MHVLLPALHPSNRGMYQQMCAQFVSVFLDAICNRRELEMIEDSVIPDHARLAQTDYDRLFAVFREVLRWEQAHKCDVVCLQECEGPEACVEIGDKYAFVGSAAARANRGYVHMYVRHGVDF